MATTAVGAGTAASSVAAAAKRNQKALLVATASLRFCLWSKSTAAAFTISSFYFCFSCC